MEFPRFRGHLRAVVERAAAKEVQVPRTRPPYAEEFKREAIELVRMTGKSIRQAAKDLGISEVSLRNWVKQAAGDAGERPGGLSSDEREELARLRRENQTLRMEREILKKAAAFFVRETDER
jgi:transposase